MSLRLLTVLAACFLATGATASSTRQANLSVDAAPDGRLAIDPGGNLWIVPGSGGDARLVKQPLDSVRAPRWSPDGKQLVFAARLEGRQSVWIYKLDDNALENLSTTNSFDLYPDWHPDGERIIVSSDTDDQGFDLFEIDIPTGLRWRLSHRPGDEIEGAWSADGRDLVYVHEYQGIWSLVLRRYGGAEEILLVSRDKISAPSWRPDGSLISYFSVQNAVTTLMIVILSEPRLIRPYPNQERFFASPVSWLDRQKMVYTADGEIRRRQFDAWRSQPVHYRASTTTPPVVRVSRERPTLAWPEAPQGRLVIRAERLFDGLSTDYLTDKDIVIDGGRISAITGQQDRGGNIVIDLGDLTILPGFIDAAARLPGNVAPSHGPDLLAMGVTSLVATQPDSARFSSLWAGKDVPGPRVLNGETWRAGALAAPETDATAAVSTSHATGISSGESLATQIRMLEVAGLTPVQILRSVGVNAAGAILADPYIGRIAPGAAADLVFVDGDPLTTPSDMLNVVAVVRNGRFYSVSGLFDRAQQAAAVE